MGAQQYRRARLLERLGFASYCREADNITLIPGLVLGPQNAQCLDDFACALPSEAKVCAHHLGLFAQPACPDTKDKTSAREEVERRGHFCCDQRFPLWQQANAGAEFDPA